MKATLIKNSRRERRKLSMRNKLRRTASLPRLSVHRTSKHISAQVIDDVAGKTLCSVTTTGKKLAGELTGKTKTQRAVVVGTQIANQAIAAGVQAVVFDRGASRYHGRVKALADAARAAGLKL